MFFYNKNKIQPLLLTHISIEKMATMKIDFNSTESTLLFNRKKKKIGYRDALVLSALVSNEGEVLSKDYLLEYAWGNTVVTEISLTKSIHDLRVALKSLSPEQDIIITMPKMGYKIKKGKINRQNNCVESRTKSNSSPITMFILSIMFLVFSTICSYDNNKKNHQNNEINVHRLKDGRKIYLNQKTNNEKLILLSKIKCDCDIFFNQKDISIYLYLEKKSINFSYSGLNLIDAINELNTNLSEQGITNV